MLDKETELKLTCDRSALQALHQWPCLKFAPSQGTDDLESVYFDTVDHVLEKAGYVKEGHLRQSAIKDGKVRDQCLYASYKPL